MEYRTNETKTLLSFMKTQPEESALELLVTYGNVREERGITSGWERCRRLFRTVRSLKEKRDRKFVLESDSTWIEVHEFNKFTYFIIDQLEKLDHPKAQEIIDLIEVKVGSVKLDRRLTFVND